MKTQPPTDTHTAGSTPSSGSPEPQAIIRAHFPPDHMMSRDQVTQSHNAIQYDRSLTDVQKHRLQGHIEHVEQYGLMVDLSVPAKEREAWSWTDPYLRKEADRG